jgi:ribose-phosphate pyrophosphokinase
MTTSGRVGMELVPKKKLHLLTGRTHPALARDIAGHLGVELGETNLIDFANSEMRCHFGESVRGGDVFIVQTHCGSATRSVNDAIQEQLIMIDAAKRASAKRVTAVCPYYGYSRQDRKSQGREPITAKLVADQLRAAGANRVVSVDLHSGQIQGFFDGPFDHLTAMPVLVEHLRANLGGDVVVVSPDPGRLRVAERFSRHLGTDMASVYKRRRRGEINQVEALGVMGEVAGRLCVLVDDMIDTAATIGAAAEQLKAQGAAEVWAAATHAVFSGPAVDRLKNSVIDRILVTDTLPLPDDKQIDKVEVLPIARIIADAIDAVFEDTSVSEIFGGENQS